MALNRGRPAEIPSDVVILSKEEAFQYQTKIMQTWKNKNDTFGYRYGTGCLGALVIATGIYVNNYYRTKLRLRNHGRLSSYLPIVAIPTVCCMVLHVHYVLPGVTLQTDCPVCIETRSAAIQATVGCILPSILAPLSALPIAVQYATYNLPYATREPGKVFEVWKKMTKPISNVLFFIFIAHALAGALVSHWEAKSVHRVNKGLIELEKSLENVY